MTRRLPRRRFLAATAGASMGITGCLHDAAADEADDGSGDGDGGDEDGSGLTEEDIRESLRDASEPGSRDAMTTFQYDLANTGYNRNATGLIEDVKVEWTFDTGGAIGTSACVDDGLVYVPGEEGILYAVDADSGEEVWRNDEGINVHTPVAVAGEMVYLVAGSLFAFDREYGEVLWTADATYSAVVHGSSVYANSGGVAQPDNRVVCYDAVTGEKRWSETVPWTVNTVVALREDTLYAVGDNTVHALDADSGERIWRYEKGDFVRIYSSPTVDEDTVYIGGAGNLIHAVDRYTGEERWAWGEGMSLEDGGESPESSAVPHSPAVKDGTLYFGDRGGSYYALDTDNREILWEREDMPTTTLYGREIAGPVIAGDTLYDSRQSLHAIDIETGERLWKFDEGSFTGSPAVADGTVYAGTDDGTLYALSES